MDEARLSEIEKRYADVRAYGEHCDLAGSVEDVPALVAEVRRLREVNAGLVRLLKDGGLIG